VGRQSRAGFCRAHIRRHHGAAGFLDHHECPGRGAA